MTLETITPEDAAVYLENNPNNRNIRPAKVKSFARDMKAGVWHVTGEPVMLDRDGALLNGQHRMLACVEAGVPYDTWVYVGLDKSIMPAIDTGSTRSLADMLTWRGEKSSALLGASITFVWRLQTGTLRNPNERPSTQEIFDWLDVNPDIRRSVQVASTLRKRLKMPASPVAAVHYLASKLDAKDAAVFFDRLGSGADLSEGDPIFAMRRFAERMAAKRDRPDRVVYAALLIKSLNGWRQGREIRNLSWRPGGATPEPFPELLDVVPGSDSE
jgi:hypothetical protein